jgi:hypothetical protein
MFRQPTLWAALMRALVSEASAEVSGLGAVPDGTQVQLARVNDSGNVVATIATTATSAGRYSFNRTALGQSLASDLVVRVANSGTGVQMRAFAVSALVDVDPVSEAAVRIVLDQIASSPGATLGQFTVAELRDIAGAVNQLTTVKLVSAGLDIGTTVAAIKNLVSADAGLSSFVVAAAVPGQTTEGPGDIGNYFPITDGTSWSYRGTDTLAGQAAVAYVTTTATRGLKTVLGTPATVLSQSNSLNSQLAEEDYFVRESRGLVNYGSSDSSDIFASQLLPPPHLDIPFPLVPGVTSETVRKNGVDFGQDLDFDGKTEKADLSYELTVEQFENVTVPAGTYSNAAKIVRKTSLSVISSAGFGTQTVVGTQTNWFAPDIGLVKETLVLSDGAGKVIETLTEELAGRYFKIVAAVPGGAQKPALGFDGTHYLLVSCRSGGSPTGVFGATVSSKPEALSSFPIVQQDCAQAAPAVAFDGSNYLVVYGRSGQIFGTLVSPAGTVVGSGEFTISDGTGATNFNPAVAFDGQNYLVVWNKFIVAASSRNVFGARVTPAGVVSAEIPVAPETGNLNQGLPSLGFVLDKGPPSLAFDGVNYLVVWNDVKTGPGSSIYSLLFAIYNEVRGARVTPSGTVLDAPGILISASGPFDSSPASQDVQIAFDGSNYLVVRAKVEPSNFLPTPAKILGRRVKPDGTVLDGAPGTDGIAINTNSLPIVGRALTFDGTNFLLAYAVGAFSSVAPGEVLSNRISPAGVLLDGPSDQPGKSISGPPESAGFLSPNVLFNGKSSLLVWISQGAGNVPDIVGIPISP